MSTDLSPQPEEPLSAREAFHDVLGVISALKDMGRVKFWLALGALTLSSLTEGASIVLLLPILHIIGQSDAGVRAIDLGGREVLGLALPDVSLGLPVLLSMVVGLVALQALFNRVKSGFLTGLLYDFTNRIRRELFRAVAEARWDRVSRFRGSELEHALTGEIARIQTVSMVTLMLLQGLLGIAIYLALSVVISIPMSLFSVGFGVLAFVLMRPFRRRAARFGTLIQANRKRQYATVADFLAGLKSARSMNGEGVHVASFEGILDQARGDAREYSRHAATGAGLFQVALAAGAALFIYLSLIWAGLAISQIVVLLLILMRLAPRFMGVQGQMQQLLIDLPAWRDVHRLRDQLVAARDDSASRIVPIAPLSDGIVLEDVTYRYDEGPDAPAALVGCSLSIPAGQVTALIGASGSGKSTVADLVTGLIRPQAGRLLFDGRELGPEELGGWREQIAYVPQDSFLLHESIRVNLRAVAPEATEAEMRVAIRQAAAEFVDDLPQGLDTKVGDRGVLLSGGQRQRIALARALLRKPRFLVLDEATSALDWASQDRVAKAVQALGDEVTVLTIAHRPSMVRFASTVYTLEAGRVVEAGRSEDLLRNDEGHLARMIRHEAGGGTRSGSRTVLRVQGARLGA
ncbi:ABC transporter ATP-binding protein [Pseudothioclava nitratireducens]|uniref:ABC transporter ATP-binding protein n=1 Tax=Pseudothioclava nitratireducens TaxID=1928646 RepID=UPI0023DA7D70|nr:ABC transporter ATP-binding protein [Defluviimonas nitratireducens]MDF1621538.1 ABC transporter ATP-binding protein [Defluviimonas nitratireducens]